MNVQIFKLDVDVLQYRILTLCDVKYSQSCRLVRLLQNKSTCSQAVFRKNVSQDSEMVLLKCKVQNYVRLGTLILAWLTMRTNLIISAVEVGESA